MGCFSNTRSRTDPDDEKLQKEQKRKIEQQFHRDKQLYRATHRLLFVGELRGTERNIVIVGRIALLRLPDSSVLKATLQNQKSLEIRLIWCTNCGLFVITRMSFSIDLVDEFWFDLQIHIRMFFDSGAG